MSVTWRGRGGRGTESGGQNNKEMKLFGNVGGCRCCSSYKKNFSPT